jgi:hypothetical protein
LGSPEKLLERERLRRVELTNHHPAPGRDPIEDAFFAIISGHEGAG